MTARAAHLVDNVLPKVPIRQWVLSVPVRVRYLMAYDSVFCSKILNIFKSEVFRWYRRRAKGQDRFESIKDAHCGSVTFIQRGGSALNLNVHFHMLALDGVYLHEGWNRPPRFIALPPPGNVDVERVVRCIRKRVIKLLDKQDGENDELSEREPLLAACVAGSLTNRVATGTKAGAATSVIRQAELIRPHNNEKSSRCANVDYFSLHANTRVGAGERKRLEKLCRYVARPPISNELLEELSDGRIAYKLKRPWQDGTAAVVFEPAELLERMAALVPPPRVHQVRYHGVLASASSLRSFVVVSGKSRVENSQNECWSELMKRAFELDVLECPRCLGTMRLIACIMERDAIRAILGSMGLPADSPDFAPSQFIPQREFDFENEWEWGAA